MARRKRSYGDAGNALTAASAIDMYVRAGKCEDALISIENAMRFVGQEEHHTDPDWRALDRANRALEGGHRFFLSKCVVRGLAPSFTARAKRKRTRAGKAYREQLRRR